MANNAQMIITNWGDAFACSVASPQLPGIVAAYDEHPDALELFNLAVDAGLDADGSIDVHIQQAMEFEGKQFFVRARHDHRGAERGMLAATIGQELAHDSGLRDYVDADRFDDAVVVATLPSDRIHDVMAGADENAPLTSECRLQTVQSITSGCLALQVLPVGASYLTWVSTHPLRLVPCLQHWVLIPPRVSISTDESLSSPRRLLHRSKSLPC